MGTFSEVRFGSFSTKSGLAGGVGSSPDRDPKSGHRMRRSTCHFVTTRHAPIDGVQRALPVAGRLKSASPLIKNDNHDFFVQISRIDLREFAKAQKDAGLQKFIQTWRSPPARKKKADIRPALAIGFAVLLVLAGIGIAVWSSFDHQKFAFAYLYVDPKGPRDAQGRSPLWINNLGSTQITDLIWHVRPFGSNSNPYSREYMQLSHLSGRAAKLAPGGFLISGSLGPGKYTVEFTASHGSWIETLSVVESHGALENQYEVTGNGKILMRRPDLPSN